MYFWLCTYCDGDLILRENFAIFDSNLPLFSAAMRKLGDKAAKAAQNDAQRYRIRIAMLPMDHLDNYLDFRNAIADYDFVRAQKIYQQAMQKIDAENKINPHAVGVQGKRFYGRFFRKYLGETIPISMTLLTER